MGRKATKAKSEVLKNSIENGGLRVINFDYYGMAQNANCIKRLLQNNDFPCQYMRKYFPNMKLEVFQKCSVETYIWPFALPFFYMQALCAKSITKVCEQCNVEN